MPGAAVTGLEADDRRLRQGEGLRPGVEGVEGLDVDLVDAVSPLPIIQNEIEMLLLLLLLQLLGRAVALAAGAGLKLALLPLIRHVSSTRSLLLNVQSTPIYGVPYIFSSRPAHRKTPTRTHLRPA
jgi:hypothetical protein